MQGLYIHIPFCAQACHYCDFHFSTSLKLRDTMVDMICKEIELNSDFFKNRKLDTIYFGGGTPSLLTRNEIEKIFDTINRLFLQEKDIEVTLEANPDDLNREKLTDLKAAGINRLSIGIQSFNENHLKFLNRLHTSGEALQSVRLAQETGFENLTIDLIYGIPHSDHTPWLEDLKTALSLDVPHISSYCLTIEPDTVFGRRVQRKQMAEADEEFCAQQFELLMEEMEKSGMEQYEISNFAKPGKLSRHNSNYWREGQYLGVGPSAHSYNGIIRRFNVSNNSNYIKELSQSRLAYNSEVLTETMRFNESLMTGIRTKWGFDLGKFKNAGKLPKTFPIEKVGELETKGLINYKDGIITLTRQGKLLADKITLELFTE